MGHLHNHAAYFCVPIKLIILSAGLAVPSIGHADTGARRAVTPNDVVAATVACVDTFIGQPDPTAFVPATDWKIARKTERFKGTKRVAYHAEHRLMNLRIQYEPTQMCTIYAFLPERVSADDDGSELSFAAVLQGTRESMSGRNLNNVERDKTDNRVVMTSENFEIDFVNVESGFDENKLHLITIQAPKQTSGN